MTYLYEFSISAQLSGAILLLFWCFSKISKNVLDMCFPGVIFAKRKETGELYIEKELVQQKVKNIFLNVWAFVYIVVGYLSNIFCENDMKNQWNKFLLIVGMTTIFIVLAQRASQYVSVAWGKEDRILTDEEIEKYNIPTTATEQDIADLFK